MSKKSKYQFLTLNLLVAFNLLFLSCTKTPEQQYRERIEKATEEELLYEIFNKTKIYKVVFKDFIADDLNGYVWNDGLITDINNGATTQAIFDKDVLYIGNHRFVGSYKSGYYSSVNGRYQVTIMSQHDFYKYPNIVKRVYSIRGVRYNQHGKSLLDDKGIYLQGLKEHPAMKANVIVIRDEQGFVGEYDNRLYKPSTAVFQSLEPLGYYEGPLDKQ